MSWLSQKFCHSERFFKAVIGAGRIVEKLGFDMTPPPLQVTRYSLQSPLWPQGAKPLKIALAADFHAGCTSVKLAALKTIVGRMNKLKADIILLPGDFLNSANHGRDGIYIGPDIVAEVLYELEAPLGVHATLGNHDFYEDFFGMYRALEHVGIHTYCNESFILEHNGQQFNMIGIGDATTGREDVGQALSTTELDLPSIAMCHNPITINNLPGDLVLSVAGHTHGGQFKIPFMRPSALGCPDTGLMYGLVQRNGLAPLVVTSGVGTSLVPWRNVAPEIVEITVSSGPA